MSMPVNQSVEHFDKLPSSALVDLSSAGLICHRSRASVYRHIKAGDLELIKVGSSSRVRVGDLRKLIQAVA